MPNLREVIAEAAEKQVAVGHFNFCNHETLLAIAAAARTLAVPVIVGTSEGERDFFGARQAVAAVRTLRDEYQQPIFLNADHCRDLESAKVALAAGYDSIIIDSGGADLETNIELTKAVVAVAREMNPAALVEGELGYIGTASTVRETIPEGVAQGENLTTVAEATRYVAATGVDLLAPAVGNIHGMLKTGSDPALDIERVRELSAAVAVPLVLHGASGNTAEEIAAAIKAGVRVVHINTELRRAYRDALTQALQENPDETTPYKIMRPVIRTLEHLVTEKLKLFNRHFFDK